MASGVFSWSTTAANNDDADADINWQEGMAPGLVNNSARAMMEKLAKYILDISGGLTSAGSLTAYTLTTNSTLPALANGVMLAFKANFSNPADGCTMNVDSLGAKKMRKLVDGADVALDADEVMEGGHYLMQYDSAADSAAGGWIILNPTFAIDIAQDLDITGQTGLTTPAADDEIIVYDASATANRAMLFSNILKVITALTAETAVALTDELAIYDVSASTADKATVQNILKTINLLTEDTAPDEASDFLLIYDTSATDVKKVKPDSIQRTITDFISGIIKSPANGDYRIALNLPYAGTIKKTTTRTTAGTLTATFKVNTTALGGTANSGSTTEQAQTHSTSNTFTTGDDFVITVASASGAQNLSFLIEIERVI